MAILDLPPPPKNLDTSSIPFQDWLNRVRKRLNELGSGGGAGTVTSVSIGTPAAGLTQSGSPITTSGTITLSLANDLAALEALTGTGFAQRTGTDTWTLSSSLLQYWTEAQSTSSPNATVHVSSFTPLGSATNMDAVITPKGTGALLADIPDNASTGGDKRGTNAVDLQTNRNNSSQVASGSNSTIGGGFRNTASGFASAVSGGQFNVASGSNSYCGGGNANTASQSMAAVVTGDTNTASGVESFVGGGSINTASGSNSFVGGGNQNTASGNYSTVPGGRNGHTRGLFGALAYSSHTLFANGDGQHMKMVLQISTNDNSTNALKSDGTGAGTSNQLVLPNNSAYLVTGMLVARQNSTGDTSSWTFTAHIKRGANAAATAMVAACTPTLVAADAGAAAWAVAVTADTTNGCLKIAVTGETSKTIRWVCNLDSVQVVG